MQQIQQSKVYNAAMWHGLYFSVFLIIRFLALVNADANLFLNAIVIGLTLAIPVVALNFGILFKRQNEGATYRHFFSHGFFMFFFASLILTLFEYIYYSYIDQSFITEQYQLLLNNIDTLKVNMPELTQIEAIVKESPIPTASQMSMQNIWMYSSAGIIISLINSLILSKINKWIFR